MRHAAFFLLALVVATSFVRAAGQAPVSRGTAMTAEDRTARGLLAQQPFVLRGRVVSAGDPAAPMVRVRLLLRRGFTIVQRAITDEEGRFEILMPGSRDLILTATKSGFATATLAVPTTPPAEPLVIRMPRGGVISGTVIDPSGRLVAMSGVRARALAQGSGRGGAPLVTPEAVTNELGEFRLAGLEAGRYVLTAYFSHTHPGRLPPWLATPALVLGTPQPTPEEVTVDVRAAEELTVILKNGEAALSLPDPSPGGVLTGAIVDELGEPIEGLRVQLWTLRVTDGRRTLRIAEASALSDDRGHYRLAPVPPGTYYLGADDPAGVVGDPTMTADTPVLYPGSASPADALAVDLDLPSLVPDLNMVFTPRLYPRVRGTVLDAAGQPNRGRVTLVGAIPGAAAMPARTVSAGVNGEFEFVNVPPGTYVLRAAVSREAGFLDPSPRQGSASQQPAPLAVDRITTVVPEFAVQRLTVGTDDVGPLRLDSRPSHSLHGRVVIEGGLRVALNQFRVSAVAVDPDVAIEPAFLRQVATAVPLKEDGTFALTGLAGAVRLVVNAPAGWWLKSVRGLGARTATDTIEVMGAGDEVTLVVANTAATVRGRVLDDVREPGRIVLLFAADATRRYSRSPYIKTVNPDNTGRFAVMSVPPGDYFVVAVVQDARDQSIGDWWTDPDMLLALVPVATRIRVAEGEELTTDLRLLRVPR